MAFGLAIVIGSASAGETARAWGKGLWALLTLAMQFTLAMISAHACSTASAVKPLLERLASLPRRDKPYQAVALMGMFSLATAWINWALNLVACAVFIPFVARSNPRAGLPLLVAASYLGLGTVWHTGLSGSAPLIIATPDNFLITAGVLREVIPTTQTLFSAFNLVYALVISALCMGLLIAMTPKSGPARARRVPVRAPATDAVRRASLTPSERINRWPGWNLMAAGVILYNLAFQFSAHGFGRAWTIDAYNSVFLSLALILHWRPGPFLSACREGVKNTWGIILQFPFYAGIFGIMNYTGLGEALTRFFASVRDPRLYPFVIYVYSAVINIFVPSGGSKWAIEAPYILPAGAALGVSPSTVTMAYAYGDMTTNLIQPFWAIPLLGSANLRFGEIMGYCLIICILAFLVTAGAMFLIPLHL